MHGIEARMRLIAVDMDGTLVGPDGRISERNLAAMKAAEKAGVVVVVATGRRHCYAMRVLRGLGLREQDALISSNGTVTRTIGAKLLDRTLSNRPSSILCAMGLDFEIHFHSPISSL